MNNVIILRIGDTVTPSQNVIASVTALRALLRRCKQQSGTIVDIADDGEAYPVRVEFENGERFWFDASELERVGE